MEIISISPEVKSETINKNSDLNLALDRIVDGKLVEVPKRVTIIFSSSYKKSKKDTEFKVEFILHIYEHGTPVLFISVLYWTSNAHIRRTIYC